MYIFPAIPSSLQWHHNECNGITNHQHHDCLLNRLFGHRSKKTSMLRVTGLCEVNSPLTNLFPAQRASNRKNTSIWWLCHALNKLFQCQGLLILVMGMPVDYEYHTIRISSLDINRHDIGRTCRQPSFPRWRWVPRVIFLIFLWPQSGRATPSWAVINTISPLF